MVSASREIKGSPGSISARDVLLWPSATGEAGLISSRGRRLFDSVACSEVFRCGDFPAIMLYSCCIAGPIKANNCPTTPFKIGIPRNSGRGFASSWYALICWLVWTLYGQAIRVSNPQRYQWRTIVAGSRSCNAPPAVGQFVSTGHGRAAREA